MMGLTGEAWLGSVAMSAMMIAGKGSCETHYQTLWKKMWLFLKGENKSLKNSLSLNHKTWLVMITVKHTSIKTTNHL